MAMVSIEPMGIENLLEIKQISDICFGFNYLTELQLEETFLLKGVFLKTDLNKATIGFCLSLYVDNNTTHESIFGDPIPSFLSLPYSVIKTIAVLPEFQNRGFGFQILEKVIHQMNIQFNSTCFIYPAWTESDSFGFTQKISKIGFQSVQTIPNFWYTDSLKKNYQCIKCGIPPCHCSLTVFKMQF